MVEIGTQHDRLEKGLPPEWQVKPLGDLASFRTGPFGSALHKSDYVVGGIPLVNPMHIINGSIVPTPEMTVNPKTASRLSEYALQEGDIVIARRGEMGRCAVVGSEEAGWLCGTGSLIIRPGDRAVSGLLQRILASSQMVAAIENASVGSTMVNLNQGILERLEVQTPPLPEQRAIAEALSDVDALIERLDTLVAKKCAVKTATMQQLLTGQQRLPGFDGAWETRRLGEIVSKRSQRVRPGPKNCNHFCIELEHISQGTGSLTGYVQTTPESSLKAVFHKDDVLFAQLRSYLRKYWFADRSGVCSTEIWVLNTDRKSITPAYLYHNVTRDKFIELASKAHGTHMPRADWKVVKEHILKLPPIEEQQAIATILSDMDTEIEALEARRDKTQNIKQGMMQELLTGRTRLV